DNRRRDNYRGQTARSPRQPVHLPGGESLLGNLPRLRQENTGKYGGAGMNLGNIHPYVGPRPFKHSDAHLFFGRNQEADDLVSLIHAHPVVVLYAESGAGKSSLLNAKIVPLLEARSSHVFPIARVKGHSPSGSNVQSIRNVYVFNSLVSLEISPSKLEQLLGGRFGAANGSDG